MIKFFRRIRQRLLSENTFSKYLLYAIGEIVLVVIGILIALQINNWNENQIENRVARRYLNSIVKDLENQLEDFDLLIEKEKNILQLIARINTHFNENQGFAQDDDIIGSLHEIMYFNTFEPYNATLTEMISSGSLKLISNFALRDQIINYHQTLVRAQGSVNSNSDRFGSLEFSISTKSKLIRPIASNYLSYDNKDLITENAIDMVDANPQKLFRTVYGNLQKPEVELEIVNSLVLRQNMAISHINHFVELRKKTSRLITEIESALTDVRNKDLDSSD